MRLKIFFIISIFALYSCSSDDRKLSLAVYMEGSSSALAGEAIRQALADEGWQIELKHLNHSEAIEALQQGDVDLAIASNEISLDSDGLRTIIPLYSESLFTLIRKESPFAESKSIEETITLLEEQKAKVMFSYQDSYAHKFAKRLLANEGFDESAYETYYYRPGEDYRKIEFELIDEIKPDVIYHMGTNSTVLVDQLLHKGYICRNSDPSARDIELGYLNSFAQRIPRSFPIILPEYSISKLQNEPLATIGLYSSLICNKNLDEGLVYELANDLMWAQPHLIELNPVFFDMSEEFDRRLLNYRVHAGARSFLERDKPGFFERYAELTGVIFSMSVVFFGALATLRRIISQRKKDRVDTYYLSLIEARQEENVELAIEKVQNLEETALNQLVEEKLSADSSFVVLMQLIDQVRKELVEKLKDT